MIPNPLVCTYTAEKDGYYHLDIFQFVHPELPPKIALSRFIRNDMASNCTGWGLFKPGARTGTGLRDTCHEDWKYGDFLTLSHDGRRSRSLAVVSFTESKLNIHLFPGWYCKTIRELEGFICQYVDSL